MEKGPMRDRLLDSLHRRAQLLADATRPGHTCRSVDAVLAMFAGHVLMTALVALGSHLAHDWCSRIFDAAAEDHGVCRFCHSEALVKDLGMCQPCWDRVTAEEEQAIREMDLADEPAQGSVS